MSLTYEDLLQIKSVVEDVADPRFTKIEGQLEAIENDVKELYKIATKQDKTTKQVGRRLALHEAKINKQASIKN